MNRRHFLRTTDGVGGGSNQTRKLGLNGLADLFHGLTIAALRFGIGPTSTELIRT